MPLSCLMWTRTGGPDSPASREQSAMKLSRQTVTSASAARAVRSSPPVIAPITRIGASAK